MTGYRLIEITPASDGADIEVIYANAQAQRQTDLQGHALPPIDTSASGPLGLM
ncbi:hypothetical protein ACFFYR_38715 [Paraburkholderia dipogonis]|uniref:hypothetical protein n=1 Tax=Paraburkholderia dipogonis TaxID=1211383 RepID=UPI00141B43B7|nr:hypothetical protein [Paraburkholderia dipogonis]